MRTRCIRGITHIPIITSFHLGKETKCNFRWVMDSKAAIATVTHQTSRMSSKRRQPSNTDYMGIIRDSTTKMRRRIEPVWVKGHQTLTISTGRTKQDVQWNNHVDNLATWYRNQHSCRQSVEITDHTPEAWVAISINGTRIVG